jgi:hypothetical protein
MYLRKGALYTHKQDQVVKGCRYLRSGLLVRAVIVCRYMSEGHFIESAEGAQIGGGEGSHNRERNFTIYRMPFRYCLDCRWGPSLDLKKINENF